MKGKIVSSGLLAAALFTFGIGAAAQKSLEGQTQQDQTTQGQTSPGMMGGGMMGGGMMGQGQGRGMMGQGGMMGTMGQMMSHHQQMSGLMNRMMESMAAIQSETDPVQLKSKLAEFQKLLNEMHSQMMGQGRRMNMMSGQMQQYCPNAGTSQTPATK
jgi:hypothetical protein